MFGGLVGNSKSHDFGKWWPIIYYFCQQKWSQSPGNPKWSIIVEALKRSHVFSKRDVSDLPCLRYAMITGAIAGVFLADYWILKARVLDIEELYSATGVNWHLWLKPCCFCLSRFWKGRFFRESMPAMMFFRDIFLGAGYLNPGSTLGNMN